MLVFWGVYFLRISGAGVFGVRGGGWDHGAGAKGLGTGNGCKKLGWERPERSVDWLCDLENGTEHPTRLARVNPG